jgi:hypothetical protein
MPKPDGEQLCASLLMTVGELRSWVKQVLDDPSSHRAGFHEFCSMSEQLLSAATELTGLAIQVTHAAQVLHNHGKNNATSGVPRDGLRSTGNGKSLSSELGDQI